MSTTRPDPLDHQDGNLDAETCVYTTATLRSSRGSITYLVRDGHGKIVDGTQFKAAYRARDLCNALNRAWGDGYAQATDDERNRLPNEKPPGS